MSRIGRMPITIPAGVTVNVSDSNLVTVKGPLGELSEQISKDITVKVEGTEITFTRPSDDKNHRALHGLSRALTNNMIIGVTKGFQKELDMVGVGYRATKSGKTMTLAIGFSHPVELEDNADITYEVPTQTHIIVKGISKQKVGEAAAKLRAIRSPEPYHGKGIRYADEYVRMKEGKTGK